MFGSYDHYMIVYPVCVFDDQWPFCCLPWQHYFFFFFFKKRNFLNDNSSKTTEAVGLWVQMQLGIGQFKIAKSLAVYLLVWLPWQQKAPIDIMGKWLNCMFSITSEVFVAIFGSYDHMMIVYSVFMFYDRWPLCLVATAIFSFEKGLFQMTTSKPLEQYDSNLAQKLLG